MNTLVAEVVVLAEGWRRPPTIKTVRARLAASGVLRAERCRLLGLVPVTRHPGADPEPATWVRQGYGVPAAVGKAVQETQAAAMPAVTAAVAANSSASSSASS